MPMSGAQDRTASQPVTLLLAGGASARAVGGVRPVSPSNRYILPGHPVTSAEVTDVYSHYVFSYCLPCLCLADLAAAIRVAGLWCLPLCWGRPDGGLMPSTAAKADGAPIV